jgi:diaminohydroxyphosphoribosylaminopyrimidine deaminase/5-amino-6-(5-phosphoribosylamino)uracil reductase
MNSKTDDERHMRHALRLARRALGRVAPNPAVGCVLVSVDGVVVGRGWTDVGGRPHAETRALEQAGARAKHATAYVTLEPCAHYGATPPCADALIAAGISRVVGAIIDPDPRVAGKGFATLDHSGVSITQNICEREAHALNKGFFLRVEHRRPLVALKSAESADGFVAGEMSEQVWITSEAARRHGHLLRAQHDAILVGIETIIADDPLLNCRLEGLEDRTPLRVVLDSSLRLSPASQLARSAKHHPVLVFTVSKNESLELTSSGVEIACVEADLDGRPDIAAVLKVLAERGITRVLVEGGPKIHSAFLARDLADVIYRYRAQQNLGAGLQSALNALFTAAGTCGPNIEFIESSRFGPDLLERFEIKV